MRNLVIIGLGLLLIVGILFVFGRGTLFGLRTPAADAIDIKSIKPDSWTLYGGLERINIDDDDEEEWLQFYFYAPQALGGVIYDVQNKPFDYAGVPPPNQTPPFVVPYRLLPDYAPHKTLGYLGENDIDWKAIFLTEDRGRDKKPADPRDRLQVRGYYQSRIDRFSVFWWLGPPRGYGNTHASTSGWFSLSHDTPNDWGAWDANQAIADLWAWEPLADRSNLCRRLHWNFPDWNTLDPSTGFTLVPGDTDYFFCTGSLSEDPAYPEAQVIAYMKDGEKTRFRPPYNLNPPAFPGARVRRLTICDEIANDGSPRAVGEVDITADDGAHNLWWEAEMLPPQSIKDTIHWRLVALTERGQAHCDAHFVTD